MIPFFSDTILTRAQLGEEGGLNRFREKKSKNEK